MIYFFLKSKIRIKGKIEKHRINKLAAKVPINENIWIKYSFDDNIIEGINHGKPVNNFALKYSNKVKKTIVKNIEEWFFFVSNLARTQARPQKIANKHGSIMIANGINNLWKVSATKKAEPIQYKPNKNHPNPKHHPDKKVFFKEELRVIK